MSNQKVNFFLWKATKEDLVTAKKIADILVSRCSTLSNGAIKVEANIQDLYSYSAGEEEIEDPTIVFGTTCRGQVQVTNSDLCWQLPPIGSLTDRKNEKVRQDSYNELLKIASAIYGHYSKSDEKINSHVETKEGVTIGLSGTDIKLTKDEIDNLLKIKELVGGGKMVITKGSIRIEVYDEKETSKESTANQV
jgi:hypothetical protein